ncbi:uncharacterized protein LOC121001209 [Bufo bufo]|uniref:uncharacterized protein LOC121001209 n=1 Tax=Bufo bufo TaxID=8384 RepID=UPI001ABDE3D2|nr:uncharacterized protein LOC121001209 [Bufo bufo]
MSVHRKVSSVKKKKSYFCKVCRVACLNTYGLDSHYKDEEHKKMEEAYYGQKYGKYFYSCLQDYILCPMRTEPLIGLQYIIQLYPEVDSEDAFKCTLCKMIGPLGFITGHIESFKHRRMYLSTAYKHLLPLYRKKQSYYEKSCAVRKHAVKVEQEEKTLTVNDSKSCTSRIGVKSDFWKYNIRRQEKLEEYKKKLSAYETQKNNILQYMETLVITSPEEAELVQNLTEELESAVNVFNINTKPRQEKYYKREQSREDSEGKYSRHSDFSRKKRRSICYEKEHKPSSSSLCKDEGQSTLDKCSTTKEHETRKRSRSASKDMTLTVTFNTGSESEEKNSNLQLEQQESTTACPVNEQLVVSGDDITKTTEAIWRSPNVHEIQAKRIRKCSTDVAKWESLFSNHRPETSNSIFSWGPKSPSLNTELSPSVEKEEHSRRASFDALSAFTLFSQEGQEHGSASCRPSSDSFSSLPSPGFRSDKSPQYDTKQMGERGQEWPCTSNTVYNEAETTDVEVMHTEPEQPDDECKQTSDVTKSHQDSEAEISCDQLSEVNANEAEAPKSSHFLDATSKLSDLQSSESRHLDMKSHSQDADSNVLGNTLSSGKLHASGRQLSPEVLQLFKGKDTNSIVHILKTLSPFYPALQELDLEEFAKVLSETGAVTE